MEGVIESSSPKKDTWGRYYYDYYYPLQYHTTTILCVKFWKRMMFRDRTSNVLHVIPTMSGRGSSLSMTLSVFTGSSTLWLFFPFPTMCGRGNCLSKDDDVNYKPMFWLVLSSPLYVGVRVSSVVTTCGWSSVSDVLSACRLLRCLV